MPDLDTRGLEDEEVQFSEFLCRAIDIRDDLSKAEVRKAFEHFDPDGTGTLNKRGIKTTL